MPHRLLELRSARDFLLNEMRDNLGIGVGPKRMPAGDKLIP
jgi:hypothetical protein